MTADSLRTRPIRLGIVGAAADRGWARAAHIPAIKAVPSLALHAVATTSQRSADAAAAAFGAPLAFGDPRELIDHPEVEAIAVVVKTPAHYELVHYALTAGKPIYCEWPLGRSLEEAEALAALATDRRVVTAIGLQGQSSPWLNRLRDLVASGRIGRILSTSMLAYDDFSTGSVDVGNAYMLDVANGANALTIQSGHSIDALCFVLGEITKVSAITTTSRPLITVRQTGETVAASSPDQIALAGRLSDGAVVSFHSRAGKGGPPSVQWEIQGEEGVLRVTCVGYIHWRPLTVEFCANGADEWKAVDPFPPAGSPESQGDAVPFEHVAIAYRTFASAILSGNPSTPDFATALRRHRTIDAIARAAELGTVQRIAV